MVNLGESVRHVTHVSRVLRGPLRQSVTGGTGRIRDGSRRSGRGRRERRKRGGGMSG